MLWMDSHSDRVNHCLTSLHRVIEEAGIVECGEDRGHEVGEVALGKGPGGNLLRRLLLLEQCLPLLLQAALLRDKNAVDEIGCNETTVQV